jgi:hypothetical protein
MSEQWRQLSFWDQNKVIVRDNQVVSLSVPISNHLTPGDEIVEAPENVALGWYRDGDKWIPPRREYEETTRLH